MPSELAELARRKEQIKASGTFRDLDKVDKMSPAQITAIYLRLKGEGKVE